MMWNQWNSMVGMLNKLGSNLQSLRMSVSEDMEAMEDKVTRAEARVGELPRGSGFDDCSTVWEGLQLVDHLVKVMVGTLIPAKESTGLQVRNLESRLTEGLRNLEGSQTRVQQKVDKEVADLHTAMMELASAIRALGSEQERLTTAMLSGNLGAVGQNSPLQADVKHLATRVYLIEARIPNTTSGRLGGDSFQS